jgi:signal peptidase II
LKNYVRDYVLLFVVAGIIVALDQWTKGWVETNLALGETWAPWEWLMPYARIVHWKNTGAAFGLGQNFSMVFTVLAIVVSAAIIIYYPQVPANEWPLRVALNLQLGGALGNLVDRLTIGHVTDFISVGKFAVFNVADSSVSIGAAVLIIGMIIMERQQKAKNEAENSFPNPNTKIMGEEINSE